MPEFTWAYGVTTVPQRRQYLLPKTLKSLADAGFDHPHLFVDNDPDPTQWRREFDLEVTAHYPKLRAVGNWITALWTLYLKNPAANRYAIFQDDIIVVKGLREYLNRSPWPAEKAYCNLYTAEVNERATEGKPVGSWVEGPMLNQNVPPVPERWQFGIGALALVFDAEAVVALLKSPGLVHKPLDLQKGHHKIDGMVVTGMNQAGFREYVHAPSLVQHIGQEGNVIGSTNPMSSMGEPNSPHGVRPLSRSFPGEDFDARSLLR